MPYYDYRCTKCSEVTTIFSHIADKPASITCGQGCDNEAFPVITKSNVRLSSKSKVERMDPKYDKLVDQTIKKNPLADPSRYLYRKGDPARGKSEA